MDLKSNHGSLVINDPTLINKSRLGIHPNLLSNYSQQSSNSPNLSGHFISIPRRKQGKIDDIFSNGWLDAMKSSSPPRKKILKNLNPNSSSDDDQTHFAYSSWMLKHPSALKSFEQISSCIKNKKIAIFLDYDGTLSPIVDDPDRALMSNTMRTAVKNAAKYFPTAIITGRSRDKAIELIGLRELYYAGSHGMDIMGPVTSNYTGPKYPPNCVKFTNQEGEKGNLFQPAKDFLPLIDEVFKKLVENTKAIEGTKVENHRFCTSVHYRNVDEKRWPIVAHCVHNVLKDYPNLRLTHGRKVLEVRPEIDWNKGKALEFLLESLDLSNKDDVAPIYIGDDRSDEDAFKVLRERNQGYGILVSAVPKETKAFYSLKDPSEVMEFLNSLVICKKLEEEAEKKVLRT